MRDMMTDQNMTALVEAALEISRERAAVLARLRAALEAGDDLAALDCARELCGLHEQKSNRTHPRVN